MEAWEVGVLGNVIQTQTDIVGQVSRVSTVNDACFQSGKDFVEVHHNR